MLSSWNDGEVEADNNLLTFGLKGKMCIETGLYQLFDPV